MSAIDDHRKWILKMFAMEGTAEAQRFEHGIRSLDEVEGRGFFSRIMGKHSPTLPLDPDERVFGIYKNAYYFTPLSFIQRRGEGFERVRWKEITHCTSSYPLEVNDAVLTLTDGRKMNVRVGDLGKGWVGRISQLFHQLIERHGAKAAMGLPPMRIKDFFEQAQDDYAFLPNLEPHPTLAESRAAVEDLMNLPGVKEIRLVLAENDAEGPIADGILIRGDIDPGQLMDFVKKFGSDGIVNADAGLRRHFSDLSEQEALLHLRWD